jgi:hypothetical protein
LGQEGVEAAEGVVDALGVLETARALGESDYEVLGVAEFGSGVSGTERTIGVGDQGTALATGAGAMLAPLGSEIGAG